MYIYIYIYIYTILHKFYTGMFTSTAGLPQIQHLLLVSWGFVFRWAVIFWENSTWVWGQNWVPQYLDG